MSAVKKTLMPKLRILIDTNVIIFALHFWGKPLEILDLARAGNFELWLSPFILKVKQTRLHHPESLRFGIEALDEEKKLPQI
jgi:predicted nucleic acid-binding protein